jgi:hypothetical protein
MDEREFYVKQCKTIVIGGVCAIAVIAGCLTYTSRMDSVSRVEIAHEATSAAMAERDKAMFEAMAKH